MCVEGVSEVSGGINQELFLAPIATEAGLEATVTPYEKPIRPSNISLKANQRVCAMTLKA